MSSTEAAASPITDVQTVAAPNRRRSTMVWMSVGCVLLLVSGLARAYQDQKHEIESSITETCPFPLKDLPTTLGGWKVVEGGERTLDPLTMRITGASEYIMRTYVDELTGVSLVVLVLFGPAVPVIPHTPEICYPSSGYARSGDSADREIELADSELDKRLKCQFRSAIYSKDSGLSRLREGVYYSFRLGGIWSPNVGAGRKFPRHNPGIFKIQVQRRVADQEKLTRNDPIEQFLSHLIPAIEHRIEAASQGEQASKPDSGASTIRIDREVGLVAITPHDLGSGHLSGIRSMALAGSDSEDRLDDHGNPPDQQDNQDDRRKIENKKHSERDSNQSSQSPSSRTRLDRLGILRVIDHRADSSKSNESMIQPRETDPFRTSHGAFGSA